MSWIIDPLEPAAVAYELTENTYLGIGRAAGDEALDLCQPFPVTLIPAALAY